MAKFIAAVMGDNLFEIIAKLAIYKIINIGYYNLIEIARELSLEFRFDLRLH